MKYYIEYYWRHDPHDEDQLDVGERWLETDPPHYGYPTFEEALDHCVAPQRLNRECITRIIVSKFTIVYPRYPHFTVMQPFWQLLYAESWRNNERHIIYDHRFEPHDHVIMLDPAGDALMAYYIEHYWVDVPHAFDGWIIQSGWYDTLDDAIRCLHPPVNPTQERLTRIIRYRGLRVPPQPLFELCYGLRYDEDMVFVLFNERQEIPGYPVWLTVEA